MISYLVINSDMKLYAGMDYTHKPRTIWANLEHTQAVILVTEKDKANMTKFLADNGADPEEFAFIPVELPDDL